MTRIARFAVLMMVPMSLLAVLSSATSAVTWHNTGDTAFTATGGAMTLTSTSVSFGCTGATLTGTAPASTVGLTYAMSGTVTYSGCTLSGVAASMDCGYTFTGTSQPASGVVTGNTDITCGMYLAGTSICHVAGTRPAHYFGAVPPSTVATLTLTTAFPTVIVGKPTPVGHCPLGDDDPGDLSEQTMHITVGSNGPTPHLGPQITRTA